MASRAGPKAALKNAVVGGVILALIEGVSIGVQRVLMPMYEKQAQEQGRTIDMLDPPGNLVINSICIRIILFLVDPMMHHAARQDTRDIYVPLTPSASADSTSFDPPVPTFDPRVEEWKGENQSSAGSSASSSQNSWFKW